VTTVLKPLPSYRTSQAPVHTAAPVISVSGWNVRRIDIAAVP
jgi:hypothetical protein